MYAFYVHQATATTSPVRPPIKPDAPEDTPSFFFPSRPAGSRHTSSPNASWTSRDHLDVEAIVAGNGVDAAFHDPGSIDPDRGSGTTVGRRGSWPGHGPVRCLLTPIDYPRLQGGVNTRHPVRPRAVCAISIIADRNAAVGARRPAMPLLRSSVAARS